MSFRKHATAWDMETSVLVTDESSAARSSGQSRVLVGGVQIDGLTQNLGGVTRIIVNFVNVIIQYNGNPAYLSDVTFTNCKFELGNDAVSQWLLARISRPREPITLASTAMF